MPIQTFLIGPVVGGIIGGLTNKIAIRMLFRPYNAKYIGRWHVPLTPGIIPKEKAAVAAAIGSTISEHLLNSQVMGETLLSDEMLGKLDSTLEKAFARMLADDEPLQHFLLKYLSEEDLRNAAAQVRQDFTAIVYNKLADKAFGEKVAELAIDHVLANMRSKLLGRLSAGVLELLRDSVERMLADNINQLMYDNAEAMIGNLLGDEIGHLLKKTAIEAYQKVVSENLPKMLSAINISNIVESRINALDMEQTEKIIVEVMDKELKALVWFGVLLGFLLGFVTNII